MNTFKRNNTSTKEIKNNFNRNVDQENRNKFLKNLFLLILALGATALLLYYIFKNTSITTPAIQTDTLQQDNTTNNTTDNTNTSNNNPATIDTTVPPTIIPKSTSTTVNRNSDVVVNSYARIMDNIYPMFKKAVENKLIKGQLYSYKSFTLKYINNIYTSTLTIEPNTTGFSSYRIVLNLVNQPRESRDNVLQKNAGAVVLKSEIINGYEYFLIGLK